MFKKIFTSKQLSSWFQIALLINIIALFLDLIIYHYFSTNKLFKLFAENLNNLSLFMICLIIISQTIIIFTKNHPILVTRYKMLAIAIESFICIIFIWILSIENDIQGKSIIFSSSLSKSDHSYKLIFTLIAIFIMLLFDFYKTLTKPQNINPKTIPQVIRSTTRLVLRKHLFIFLCVFGIVKFKTLNIFARALLHHSASSLLFDLSLLEFIIPIAWIVALFYSFYQLRQPYTKDI